MIVLPKAARCGHKRPPGPSQRRPQRCQIPGIQTAENDLKSLTVLADAAVGQDVGVVVMRGGGWDRAQIHLLLGLAEAQPRGVLLAPQSRKSRASRAPDSIAGNHSWRCSSVSNTISGWQARLCTLSVNAESPFGSFASWASGPGFLTRRIGNPSPSGVESGFPAIPESLLDHHYFPHEYVLGRTATHLLCVAARRAAGQPGSA